MYAISHLLTVASAYQAASALPQTTVSWRALGDVRKLAQLESGQDIQVTRYERAMRWFSENWPEDTLWPEGISRPGKSATNAEAAVSETAD